MRTFPDDLVRVQREWSATYRQLADRPGRPELRRRLHRLSVRAFFHPYWRQRRPTPAAWWELRELARRPADTSARTAR
ncbi:hypothetical protein ACFY3O_11655 [Streptomyces sp. NPDC001046]|uniref:hypothetical protein n=1 Tax=unclassified Streptomyces TaxID=2593676 RepID=UPI0035E0234F